MGEYDSAVKGHYLVMFSANLESFLRYGNMSICDRLIITSPI